MGALRTRWPALGGLAAALGLLVLVGGVGVGREAAFWSGVPLGVPLNVWGAASAVIAGGLALQLGWQSRVSRSRERDFMAQVSQLEAASARLEHLARTDALTGVHNRREFFDTLGLEFRRSSRYGRALSVLMIDIDLFKRVNDRHGHPAGDAVLAQTAAILESSLRESDVIARYGGEEFAVLLPETATGGAEHVAEKLRAAVEAQEFTAKTAAGDAALRITVSIGVASMPDAGIRDAQSLVARADEALYAAKRGGRNRWVGPSARSPRDQAA